MDKKTRKLNTELLAPAGSLEKAHYALHFGADAIYAGLPEISMRARINSFKEEELAKAVELAHAKGKKLYITLNIYAHTAHLERIRQHLLFLARIRPDAVIVSDPGVLSLVQEIIPETEIHLSTQANVTNWRSAKFWSEQGVKRIVLAREVTLEDIRLIHEKVPEVELEYFVHGAMCMSYSGRCMLSKMMLGRSANLGDCVQPCRWAYKIKEQTQEEGEDAQTKLLGLEDMLGRYSLEAEEDGQGTYIFNSKDLCLIEHLKELSSAGVTSFKIEGRNKSAFYVGSVVRAYRKVLDVLEKEESSEKVSAEASRQKEELQKMMHRGYTKGFLFGDEPQHSTVFAHLPAKTQFVGEVLGEEEGQVLIKVHNAIQLTDELEALTPEKIIPLKIIALRDAQGKQLFSAHGGGKEDVFRFSFKGGLVLEKNALIRKVIC